MAAVSAGIPENFTFYLVSIANACAAFGQIGGGLLIDRAGRLYGSILRLTTERPRTGPLNILTPATFLAGVMTFIWPFATSVGGSIAVATIYGYVLGLHRAVAILIKVELKRMLGSLRFHARRAHRSDGSNGGRRNAYRHVFHYYGNQRRRWPSYLRRHQRSDWWIQVYGYICRYAIVDSRIASSETPAD